MPPDPQSDDKRRTPLPVLFLWACAVVCTIAIVIFFAAVRFDSPSKATRSASTQAAIATVAGLLRIYNLDTGSYPPTLDALVPKYLEKPPLDAWKRHLVYTLSPSDPPFSLGSLGADGQTGGSGVNADIWAQLP